MIQSVSFTGAAFEALAKADLSFLVSASAKKMQRQLNFQESKKKYVSKNKICFCLKKKNNVSLYKEIIFVVHTIFKVDFITQIIYCIIYRSLYSLFILFLFSYISF